VDVIELRARLVWLPLAERIVIARGRERVAELVQVELRHDGISGFGEAAPVGRYGESGKTALAFVRSAAPLLGDDPFALEEIGARLAARPGEQAAKAALDSALHDLCGKLAGVPVWRLLGLRRAGPPTSVTLSLAPPDEMARAAERVRGRFRRVKLKLGGRDGLDVERVRAVREVWAAALQVDANEAWSLEEALEYLPQLARLGVEYAEQPLPERASGGAELKARSAVPIFVDEDCRTLADVPACAERAHGVTVKLAKSGGIREAVRMVHAARALGLGTMLGCMAESGLGIGAGAQIASLFDHVDLDGNLHLARDPWGGVELTDGIQLPADAPGLGVAPVAAPLPERARGAARYAYRRAIRPRLRGAYLLARKRLR
jgi:L-alanine-DL-glutamate epimerase-like enolase superfamily enzyme